MSYIVFDLEFNQAWSHGEDKGAVNPRCSSEIIQIGALVLDEQLHVLSTFDRLIKPELYTRLHPFVEQITGITEEKLAAAMSFEEVFGEFRRLISFDSVLCVWGTADIRELIRNIRYHKLDASLIPMEYINVQTYASRYLHCPKGTNAGLRIAAELLDIPIEGRFHDALNDARYTAEIFRHIYSSSIKPAIYKEDTGARTPGPERKSKVDTEKLIKQFEKMYDRPMTEEERAIIKLAYLMGKTGQFQSTQAAKGGFPEERS
ncbi:MAG TPA: 3'-5' exonuclease [Clostridia bacterium]|nr:3'-5' exonuclease [Clostridia bacterium]